MTNTTVVKEKMNAIVVTHVMDDIVIDVLEAARLWKSFEAEELCS